MTVELGRLSEPVATLLWQLQAVDAPEPVVEHRFHPVRRWRLDVAWPALWLAIEVDGGAWVGGRHATGSGIEADCEKLSTAVALGWRVMRLTPRLIKDGKALPLVLAALQQGGTP